MIRKRVMLSRKAPLEAEPTKFDKKALIFFAIYHSICYSIDRYYRQYYSLFRGSCDCSGPHRERFVAAQLIASTEEGNHEDRTFYR